jgi:hypothetical protein
MLEKIAQNLGSGLQNGYKKVTVGGPMNNDKMLGFMRDTNRLSRIFRKALALDDLLRFTGREPVGLKEFRKNVKPYITLRQQVEAINLFEN